MLSRLLLTLLLAVCNGYLRPPPIYSPYSQFPPDNFESIHWTNDIATPPVPRSLKMSNNIYTSRSSFQPPRDYGFSRKPYYSTYQPSYVSQYIQQPFGSYPYQYQYVARLPGYQYSQPNIGPRSFRPPSIYPFGQFVYSSYYQAPYNPYKPPHVVYTYSPPPPYLYRPFPYSYGEPSSPPFGVVLPGTIKEPPPYTTGQYTQNPNVLPPSPYNHNPHDVGRQPSTVTNESLVSPTTGQLMVGQPNPGAREEIKRPAPPSDFPQTEDDIYKKANNSLKDRIRKKTAYIAALIDRENMNYLEYVRKEYQDKDRSLNEEQARKKTNNHLDKTINKAMKDIKELKSMTNDKVKSANEVGIHFAWDHVEPMLEASVGVPMPEFVNKMILELTKRAQDKVKSIFGVL